MSDNVGNPLNDGTWTYTWQHGRELASMAKTGETWSFTYNADGLRTKRTNGNRTYQYTYVGSQLTDLRVDGHIIYFFYDTYGSPVMMNMDGYFYYYVTNLQGDVVNLLNSSGEEVVRYVYDAWGNIISTTGTKADTVGYYNPLRYRGYVYDTETELYYLQSRYYNPEMGRFVNADGLLTTGQGFLGNNTFAYCGNNPVRNKDSAGNRYIDALSVDSETKKQRELACQLENKRAQTLGGRDVTTEIDNALAQGVDESISYAQPNNGFQGIAMYYHFYTLVTHGADWDIKRENSWGKTIGTSFPGEETHVYYHGMSMTPEMLGNYTYGYLGYAYGIPLEMLICGSYVAAGIPLRGNALEEEVWDWKYVHFGYWKAMQDGV